MSNQPSHDTPENWGAASRGYAEKVAPVMMRTFATTLVDRLHVDDTSDVLEVAAGSGALTEMLFPRVKSVLATDFAPQMLDVLRERLATWGANNVRCEVMDGQALDLADSSFDAAACSFGLMLFPERDKGFAELCRVVRPGGRVAISGWAGPDKFQTFELFLAALNAAFPDMPPPPEPPPVFRLANLDTFRAEMQAAGFQDVEVEFVARDLQLPDAAAMWTMLTVGAPPAQALIEGIGEDGKQRLEEQVHAVVAERFGNGPIELSNTATIGSGAAV